MRAVASHGCLAVLEMSAKAHPDCAHIHDSCRTSLANTARLHTFHAHRPTDRKSVV